MMMCKLLVLSLIVLTNYGFVNSFTKYKYKTLTYKQQVDHFSFTQRDTFTQRYLISDEHWDPNGGPIFFYAGNEGDITLFAENTGFMWEIAPEFKSMLLFAEHRYYGKSMPYGKNSFKNYTYAGYLSSAQALADYADLLTFVRTSVKGASNSSVIVFGGSYGGMLAAWFRMKYPHIVQGAIAASAPILQFIGMTPCDKFGQIVTRDFEIESKECADLIRHSWSALSNVFKKKDGKKWLAQNWNLCAPLESDSDLRLLKNYLENVWTNLAMVDYPYPASFLAPLPAHPVNVVCSKMNATKEHTDETLLKEIFNGLNVYFNYTKTTQCLNYYDGDVSQLGDRGWGFQICTEMVMPFCYNGKSDFFEPTKWNLTQYTIDCIRQWNVRPNPLLVATEYGGKHITAASNIVFSNGLLDPWSSGGVMTNLSSSLISIIIPEGAHHLDLRQSDPNDPPSVIFARNLEKHYIRKWIMENKGDHNIV